MSFDKFIRLKQPKISEVLLPVNALFLCLCSLFFNSGVLANGISGAEVTSELSAGSINNYSEDAHASLMETGDQLLTDGHFAEAEALFNQLFASVRANHGLFHEQQFTVLDRLIQLNLNSADWPSLKQHLDYHDWLLNRLYSGDALMRAEHLQINARHHEQAALATAGPARNWHLVQIRQQLWRAVSALETLPDESDRLPPLLHQIAMHHFALSQQTDLRWLTSFETRSDEPAMISGWAMQGSQISKRSYEIGAELMTRIVKHYNENSASDPATQAAVMAQLLAYRGDWELLFGRERDALDFYEQSLKLTEVSSCDNLMQAILFKNLVQLPISNFSLDTNFCTTNQVSITNARVATAELTETGFYRPRWFQNQWHLASPESALSASNSEDYYD